MCCTLLHLLPTPLSLILYSETSQLEEQCLHNAMSSDSKKDLRETCPVAACATSLELLYDNHISRVRVRVQYCVCPEMGSLYPATLHCNVIICRCDPGDTVQKLFSIDNDHLSKGCTVTQAESRLRSCERPRILPIIGATSRPSMLHVTEDYREGSADGSI